MRNIFLSIIILGSISSIDVFCSGGMKNTSAKKNTEWMDMSSDEKLYFLDTILSIKKIQTTNITEIQRDLLFVTDAFLFSETDTLIDLKIQSTLFDHFILMGGNLSHYFDLAEEDYFQKAPNSSREMKAGKSYIFYLLGQANTSGNIVAANIQSEENICTFLDAHNIDELIFRFLLKNTNNLECFRDYDIASSNFIKSLDDSNTLTEYILTNLDEKSLLNFYLLITQNGKLYNLRQKIMSEYRRRITS